MEINDSNYYKQHLLNSNLPKLIKDCIDVLEIIDDNYFCLLKNINNKRTVFNCLPGSRASIYSLNGIIELLNIGNIVDSFVLIRKIRDNLFLDLYLLSSDYNIKKAKTKNENEDINFDEDLEELKKMIKEIVKEDLNIQKWFTDAYLNKNTKQERVQIIAFGRFLKAIKKGKPTIESIYSLHFKVMLDRIDNTLENFVHSNGFTVINNDSLNKPHDKLKAFLKIIYSLIEDIFTIYLSTIILMNSILISSSDYVDALDIGLIPEKNSQYWVAEGAITFLKEHVKRKHPAILLFLRNNQEYSMDLSKV